ncbi:MAG: hypothetical protein ACR2LJ_08730 [Acidimicrobiales bacterium]
MYLVLHLVGPGGRQGVEQLVPLGLGDHADVVGRGLGLGAGGPYHLEQRVRLGKVDDAGHGHHRLRQPGPADG